MIDTIQRTAPIHATSVTPPNSETSLGPSKYQWYDPVQPIRTQVHQNQHKVIISTLDTPLKAPSPATLPSTNLPIIKLAKDIKF